MDLIIKRIWSMPNKWTFKIKPIKDLIYRYVKDGKGWIDPFAGKYSPAELTNDLNPDMPTIHHLSALTFLKAQKNNSFIGVLFDPPYSPRQVKEVYNGIGIKTVMKDTQASVWSNWKKEIARIVKPNGIVICCGWNSMGIGKNRGFKMLEILLVPHGGAKNDTIVTVEQKEENLL